MATLLERIDADYKAALKAGQRIRVDGTDGYVEILA